MAIFNQVLTWSCCRKKKALKDNFGTTTRVRRPLVKRGDTDTDTRTRGSASISTPSGMKLGYMRTGIGSNGRGLTWTKGNCSVRRLRVLGPARHVSIREHRAKTHSFIQGGVHSFLFPETESSDVHSFAENRQSDALADALADEEGHPSCRVRLGIGTRPSTQRRQAAGMPSWTSPKKNNVFVDSVRFILADFDLARITESTELGKWGPHIAI